MAIALAFSAGAMAENMSKDQYASMKDGIVAQYKTAKSACGSFSANARDICMAQANGNENVAKAELEARYKPSVEATYDVRTARADAAYAIAREKCDDLAGNAKDVCVKTAKADEVAAKADAGAQMKISIANEKAAGAASTAYNKANETSAEARKDAAADKRDAEFALAKQKCDAYAGDAKSSCMNDAKARFGKS